MPDGRSSSAPTLSDSVSANKRDPPPSRPSLPPHVIPPPAAHPTAPLNTNNRWLPIQAFLHIRMLQNREQHVPVLGAVVPHVVLERVVEDDRVPVATV